MGGRLFLLAVSLTESMGSSHLSLEIYVMLSFKGGKLGGGEEMTAAG